MSDAQDTEIKLTPEEQVKEAMLDPLYWDTGHWRHSEVVQRVHELARIAWPDPSTPPSKAPPSPNERPVGKPEPPPVFKSMWGECANPRDDVSDPRPVVWTPEAAEAFIRKMLAPPERRPRWSHTRDVQPRPFRR